jgi:hypothetical protein
MKQTGVTEQVIFDPNKNLSRYAEIFLCPNYFGFGKKVWG